MTVPFVHLRVHTEYSLVDGLCRIKPLITETAKLGIPVCAITDQHNLFAVVKFYQAAEAQGIKPILGADVFISDAETTKEISRLTLLCQNDSGFRNLTQLLSRGYLEGYSHGRVVLKKAWLLEQSAGLIVLSGAEEGDVGQAIKAGAMESASLLLRQWQENFPDRYYIELTRLGRLGEEDYIRDVVALAKELGIPVVATNDVRFLYPKDFEIHEARVCINQGVMLSSQNRPRVYYSTQYLKSPDEMALLFVDLPEALENSQEIAIRCNVKLDLGRILLPNFQTEAGVSVENYLDGKAKEGLKNRLAILMSLPQHQGKIVTAEYESRLDLELSVIHGMGFSSYFLIVADFIAWARKNGVPVGPGRGSGAGSLVAYALQITDLDPLQYDLLFERFLNPERVSMPDFDIDFCMDKRDRVIDYVTQAYGRERVSQIITFGTMAAKAAVRDVGRTLGHPYGFVDKIAKLIPFELGITLDKALEDEVNLKKFYDENDEVREIIDLARELEGITKNAGKHAGGVVIAPSNLTDYVPLYCEEGSTHPVTQLDKDDVEAIGLVKFDFLGLRTLTIIDWACLTINRKRTGNDKLDISLIPLDCQKTFQLLKANETTAVFQLESRGMKDLIKRLQPDCFEDIIALVALFRPGPLQSGMVDDFINRKHGRERVRYPHPDLEPILSPTYGVILYQEQVMQIAQVLAGYTLGAADLLRRAMGKKKAEEMAEQRNFFVEGAKKRGIAEPLAASIFDLMEKFAGYGFNKSHSAAYALVSYQTAWLKAHYPADFMAAVLSADMDNTDKVVLLIEECRRMKLNILPPDIQSGEYKFITLSEKEIGYGLGAIKGLGEAAVALIADTRHAEGEFLHLFDFCNRLDLRKVNRRALEALIRAGALDKLAEGCPQPSRARAYLSALMEPAMAWAEQQSRQSSMGQMDLFGASDAIPTHSINAVDWSDSVRLKGEKETLGLYLTGHPLDPYWEELRQLTTCRLGFLAEHKDTRVRIAGVLIAMRTIKTKKGHRMATLTLDDKTGRIEVVLFPSDYEKYFPLLQLESLCVLEGLVAWDDFVNQLRLRCDKLMTFDMAREAYVKTIVIDLTEGEVTAEFSETLRKILTPYLGGNAAVCIQYQDAGLDAPAMLALGEQWRVRAAPELLGALREWLGETAITLNYQQ